ncbi:MAG: cytochrome P450 [Omnitrophica WOR_2 bacterium]
MNQASLYPPGPRTPALIEAFKVGRRNPIRYFSEIERKYGPIASLPIPKATMVLATKAESVRSVLIENAKNFTNREAYIGLVPLLGNGLLTIDGPFHKQQRRLVMPAFHKQRVETYADLMVDTTLDMLKGWTAGQPVDMAQEMQYLTLRIVAKALFNVNLDGESSELGKAFIHTVEYLNKAHMMSISNLHLNLPFTAYGRFRRAKAILDQAVYRIIENHRRASQDYGDFLSMLLKAQDEEGNTLSDQQIHDQTMTFLAAGHATTANALTWTFYLLSQHPEIYQKLMGEIDQVTGGRQPSAADLPDLPYLEMVVKESMRLYPPAWAIVRHSLNDFELEGYCLPGGTYVILSQYITHRLPEYWSQPDRFWPERFDSEHKEPRRDFAYFPFGAGPRTCIGMPFAMLEARLLLATILQRFHPALAPGARVIPQPLVTLRPRWGMPMILKEGK